MANSPPGAVLSRLRTMLEREADATGWELLHRLTTLHEEVASAEPVRQHGPMVKGEWI